MNVSAINSNPNFKSALPVWCYARDPESEAKQYYPVVKPKNMDKCFNFIVRNLNGTAGKDTKNFRFLRDYIMFDMDYMESRVACSVTKPQQQYGFLFTGNNDVSVIRKLGKMLGLEKAYNKTLLKNERTLELKQVDSFETERAREDYFKKAKDYTRQRNLKTKQGKQLGLEVYFDAVYKTNKSGERELKGFNYVDSYFVPVDYMDN